MKINIVHKDPQKHVGEINIVDASKYFTPSIEDIRVGYECEFTGWLSDYKEVKITQDNLSLAVGNLAFLKVSYLTKEQIEAEGWELKSDSKEAGYFINKINNYKLYYNYNTCSLRIGNGKEYEQNSIIFDGYIKDINTFRYIIKLLGI